MAGDKKEEKIKTETLSVRLPADLVAALEKYAEIYKVTRTSAVGYALYFLFNCKRCLFCGAHVPQGSFCCPKCGRQMYENEVVEELSAKFIEDYVSENNLPSGDDNGYVHNYDLVCKENETGAPCFSVEYTLITPRGDVLKPEKEPTPVDREKVYKYLPSSPTKYRAVTSNGEEVEVCIREDEE